MAKVLNARQAAALLGITERVCREWLKAGKIPGRKVGKLWLVSEDALLSSLAPMNGAGAQEAAQ